MTDIKDNYEEQKKHLMFHIIQEVIINERSTVSYCRYLVNKFKKFYPQEKNLHKHLDNNLKTLSDKNEMEENEIMSQFLK